MNELRWYVLKVISKKEEKVKLHLEGVFAKQQMEHCGIKIVIPYKKVYTVRAGKKKIKNHTLFPGYVFIHADLSDSRLRQLVKEAPDALGFLSTRGWGMSNTPVPLQQEEVDRMLGKENELNVKDFKLEELFVVNEMVKIVDGPFSGFLGRVQEISEDHKKLNVIVKIFERSTPVEVSYTQVGKLF